MSVPVVVQQSMELTPASLLNPRIVSPLIASEWLLALQAADLSQKYPHIPTFISHGADTSIPHINSTFTPPNHPSIASHKDIFLEIVDNKFTKGRYWSPYSKADVEDIMGPFQTSPLLLIPKPSKPGKFRLIQNLSYPLVIREVCSINSSITADLYLCTWGTFVTVATIVPTTQVIRGLPRCIRSL